jgi:hypothetical protein
MNLLRTVIALLVLASSAAISQAHAEPAAIIKVTCTTTGPGIVACVSIGAVLHELVKLGNGEEAFGRNGEIAKALAVPVKIMDGNLQAAKRESGDLDKALRVIGPSVRDIKKHGIRGGRNSVFRKPFG